MKFPHITISVVHVDSGYFLATLNLHPRVGSIVGFNNWNSERLTAETLVFADGPHRVVGKFPLADPHAALEQVLGPLQFQAYVRCDSCEKRIPRDEAHFSSGTAMGDYCGCDECRAERPFAVLRKRVAA